MTVGPKGSRNRSASPVFSPADTDETMNPSMSFSLAGTKPETPQAYTSVEQGLYTRHQARRCY